MSFKSKAQRQHALEQVKMGNMTKAQFEIYDKETVAEAKTLPERTPEKPQGLVRGDRQTRKTAK